MRNNAENPKRGIGYAIVTRFDYKNGELGLITQAALARGQGVIFLYDGNKIDFEQSNITLALEEAAEKRTYESMALVDIDTGSLLFLTSPKDKMIGIGKQMPHEARVQELTLGDSIEYGLIWGENKEEVIAHFRELQRESIRNN